MSLFLLEVELYNYEKEETDLEPAITVYSSFEKARKGGISELNRKITEATGGITKETFKKMIEEEKLDYSFTITEIEDLEYAENFNIRYDFLKHDEYLKLEPTHKVNYLDYNGNIEDMLYDYRINNLCWECMYSIKLYPQDLEKGAGERFKIGDFVKLKNIDFCSHIDDNKNRIYVVKELPKKEKGAKYFKNVYELSSLYETDNQWGNKEVFTFDYYEANLEKCTEPIDETSEYGILSKILKGEIQVSWDTWHKIIRGELPITDKIF